MSGILIVFATQGEAEATLRSFHAEPVPGERRSIWTEGVLPSLYTFEYGWIALSSIGIPSALMTVAQYGREADAIWNLGVAGALQDLPIGAVLNIKSVRTHTLPPLIFGEGSGRLLSSDIPIHDPHEKMVLKERGDVVDMEGYGVAFAAEYLGKKCRMWKIVSDFASPGGSALIKKNKKRLSEHLAELLYEALHESSSHP